ncbi:MAG: endonuclease domain-containing protein [Salinivirgaceae bacterium]|jgi:very-short-patch-repair endonuclease|nr:endonuclease domain-containing protein [Salinivirgaceae bacterium]
MTKHEEILWEFLRKKKVTGLRFRRQHPIYMFIADFYCHALKLVIELDGGYHKKKDQQEYDINRTAVIEEFGIKVIRYTNEQIEKDFQNIKQKIIKECVARRQLIEELENN